MKGAGITKHFGLAMVMTLLLLLVTAGTATAKYNYDPEKSLTGFVWPQAVAIDLKGNIYVASYGNQANGSQGKIDVFDPDGNPITTLPVSRGPQTIAVDSEGVLYVTSFQSPRLVRYKPSVYGPEPDDIAYGNPPETLVNFDFGPIALAINKDNDHLFAHFSGRVGEFGSAAEGNPPLPDVVDGLSGVGTGLAIDTEGGRIYLATNGPSPGSGQVVRVHELEDPHAHLLTIDGSTAPGGQFFSLNITLAVDEGTGHLFVYDGDQFRVDEMTEDGDFVEAIEHKDRLDTNGPMDLEVDNGPESPNGVLNPEGRYLFVPSDPPPGVGNVFAFAPGGECPPEVESISFDNVTEAEAELRATINPCDLPTTYTFEYVTQEQFEEETVKFENASGAGGGELPAGSSGVPVNTGVSGLAPETAYRFRVVAENELGEAEAEGAFGTYPVEAPLASSCPNEALRIGFSALLPDCRAYELVTPADTNSRTPIGLGDGVPTMNASPDGEKVSFKIEGGSLGGGTDATGSLLGDPYLVSRGEGGWTTSYAGPSGAETEDDKPIAVSPDQGHVFWNTGATGSMVVGGKETAYVRYPDGHSELVGRGSLGTEPRAGGKLISPGGGHIIFETGVVAGGGPAKQLEPDAAPDGTPAIYDRTSDGVTHVVSLLPGDVPLGAGQDPLYEGSSLDGRGVAFTLGGTLYLRYDNQETYAIGAGVTFAGVAEGGNRIFFLEGGKLRRFDAVTGETTDFNPAGTAIPVNVARDGSTAYFVSTTVLTTAPNPRGEEAQPGAQNLYLSREGDNAGEVEIEFVATVTEEDVIGETTPSEKINGLGLWTRAVGTEGGAPGRYGIDPSRTNPDGSVLLFQSEENLTGYESGGKAQIYRFDSVDDELQCLSCNPTGAPASEAASLQPLRQEIFSPVPLNSAALVENLSPDGNRAFFQSSEPIVPRDTDGLQDVYEWVASGTGSCARPGGCVYLISSPHSDRIEYLYAVADAGNDVFFRSSDLLVPADTDETPSIYDARVGGGFPSPTPGPCPLAQSCPGPIAPPPLLPTPASQSAGPSGNVKPRKGCPKGKRKIKRKGKVRCVKVKKKTRKNHRRDKAGAGRKGGAR